MPGNFGLLFEISQQPFVEMDIQVLESILGVPLAVMVHEYCKNRKKTYGVVSQLLIQPIYSLPSPP